MPVTCLTGLIVPLGLEVLRQACEQLRTWSNSRLKGVSMVVNVSMVQLSDTSFVRSVADILQATGVNGNRLEFEITESTLMKDPEATLEVLRQLKGLSVRIAVDDFGTGYSSLSYLRRFPVDTVKIDRSFGHDIETNSDDKEIVKAILALSHSLGMNVIAEGVETDEQASILTNMSCAAMQGFLFARPADSLNMSRWLEHNLAVEHYALQA